MTHDTFFSCPHCGSPVRSDARVCRECGASDDCGWNEEEFDDQYDSFEDDDFDYDEFVAREFPEQASRPPKPWVGAIILAIIVSLVLTLIA